MNERILQLASEAKIMTEESINMKISFSTQLKAFAEKFAELIVRECVLQCHHNDDMDRIEEHFGEEMNKSLGIRLISKEVKLNLDTFAPELELTVRIPLEFQEQVVIDPEIETTIGKEILTLLGHKR